MRSLQPAITALSGRGEFDTELALRLPSDIGIIEAAVSVVARHVETRFRDAHAIRFNLRVALSEGLANAMLYGNGGDPGRLVGLLARYGPTAVEVEITDAGDGFDPAAVPDPTLPENLERADGRGVFLIRRLMDDVRFNPKGNSLCMILRRA